MIVDLASVRVSGAIEIARARALWNDGALRLFNKAGIVWEAESKRPELTQFNWGKHWLAETTRGNVVFKARCLTCGGWGKVARIPAEMLWESAH